MSCSALVDRSDPYGSRGWSGSSSCGASSRDGVDGAPTTRFMGSMVPGKY